MIFSSADHTVCVYVMNMKKTFASTAMSYTWSL